MKIAATLKFITPCFCAGAERLVAEIRAPSIRGELRWWFRCLGGIADEKLIFGSVAGDGNASLLQVRVADQLRSGEIYSPTHARLEDQGSYIHFYLDQPPRDGKSRLWLTPPDRKSGKKGTPRPESCMPSGSQFTVHFVVIRQIATELEARLKLAIQALFRFGSIGFRHTRGFGAWHWENEPMKKAELEEFADKLEKTAPGLDFWFASSAANQATGLLTQIENKLKNMRKPSSEIVPAFPAKEKTSLGYTGERGRQASAIRFRPVQFQTAKGDDQFTLVIFQAPDSILGSDVKEPRRIVPNLIPK